MTVGDAQLRKQNTVTKQSKTRTLLAALRRIRRLAVRADATLTLAPVVFWVAVISIAAVIIAKLRRRSARPALAGPGDDKPPGYENPTADDVTGHTAP
jgi:hypothetical protein